MSTQKQKQNENQIPAQTLNPSSADSAPAAAPASKPRRTGLNFTDAKARTTSDKLLRWELLETRLAPVLDTMPHVKPFHAELVRLIGEAKAVEFDVKLQKAQLRQKVADRDALVETGESVRSRLATAIAFKHGPTSVLLTEFGLRPRRGKKVLPEPPPPAPELRTAPPTPAEGTGSATALKK